jgi:hypothetical protein
MKTTKSQRKLKCILLGERNQSKRFYELWKKQKYREEIKISG